MRSALSPLFRTVAVLGLYVLIAVCHSWPLATCLSTCLPGTGLGDNTTFVWNIWWMRQVFPDVIGYFSSTAIMAPVGSSLVLHTHAAWPAAIAATALRQFSEVEAYNLLMVGSLALNALATYGLASAVTGRFWPSVAAGAVFVVAPPVALRLLGHQNLVVVWPFIVAMTAWVRVGFGAGWPLAVLTGLAFAATCYTDYYQAVYLLMCAGAYAAVRLIHFQAQITVREGRGLWRSLIGLAALSSLVGAAIWLSPLERLDVGNVTISLRSSTNAFTAAWLLLVGAAAARWRLRLSVMSRHAQFSRGAVMRSMAIVVATAAVCLVPLLVGLARLDGYVAPGASLRSSPPGVDIGTVILGPPLSGLVGSGVQALYQSLDIDMMESGAWLGAVLPLYLLVLLRRQTWTVTLRTWLTILLVFVVWSLGPHLTAFGTRTGVLLPQALAHYVPILDNARIPSRAMIVVALAGAIGLAICLTHVRRRYWLHGVVVALAVAEGLAWPLPVTTVPPLDVYRPIEDDDADVAVLSVPFGLRDGFGERGTLVHEALLAQTVHRHRLAGGFVARLSPAITQWYDTYEPFSSLLRATPLLPCREASSGLRSANVGYVVFYRRYLDEESLAAWQNVLPGRVVAEDTDRLVVRLTDCETTSR